MKQESSKSAGSLRKADALTQGKPARERRDALLTEREKKHVSKKFKVQKLCERRLPEHDYRQEPNKSGQCNAPKPDALFRCTLQQNVSKEVIISINSLLDSSRQGLETIGLELKTKPISPLRETISTKIFLVDLFLNSYGILLVKMRLIFSFIYKDIQGISKLNVKQVWEIGSRVGRNQSTVMRICDSWMKEGNMNRRGRSHPPQCTTSREDRQIVRKAVTDRSVTSRTVAQHIESVTHHSVSTRTI
ncbi:HTH_Tnp_Tc3_2 domain-containing protein [Trichonephila clavipes]|nr:HTH_Tnp_Tc3_2 domain-containing protein [Trichonephila clavipes]